MSSASASVSSSATNTMTLPSHLMPEAGASVDRPVIYDMTRLVTRVLSDAPNGIDRVDLALARHFANRPDDKAFALLWTIAGPRLFSASVAGDVVRDVESHWREFDDKDDALYEEVVHRLVNPGSRIGPIVRPSKRVPSPFISAIWNYVLRFGRSPERDAPDGAAYLNASHFPLEYARHLRWLFKRRDVVPAFFIHDLLPISCPQYFWPREPERHRRRLDHIRELRGRAIVASSTVASQVQAHFASDHYSIPVLKAALPVSPIFRAPRRVDSRLTGRPYFVVCGTIEPRKNHVLLLNLWREMANESKTPPALVLVGKRGWNAEAAIGMLERSGRVSEHVVEVSGLSTPALKRLMDNAAALLAPSFSEGFGLPVLEAAAAGLPVIAADIEAFREMRQHGLVLVNTLDGMGWLSAIREKSGSPCSRIPYQMAPSIFESSVEQFLASREMQTGSC
jgi:glycosyltransferase involved in cell wall biosynthesis